jgi:putative membrane protein
MTTDVDKGASRVGANGAPHGSADSAPHETLGQVDTPPHETLGGADSAPRRTLMAAERTYLAWLRTGLGTVGLALAVGRLLPALLGGSHVRYAVLGAGYGALGIFIIAYALLRARRLQATIFSGEPVTLDWWALVLVTVLGLTLAAATIVMVLAAM